MHKTLIVSSIATILFSLSAFGSEYADSTGSSPDPVVFSSLPSPKINIINNSYNDIINHQIDRRLNDIVGILSKRIDKELSDKISAAEAKMEAEIHKGVVTNSVTTNVLNSKQIKEGGVWLSNKYLGINGKAKNANHADSSGHADRASRADVASNSDRLQGLTAGSFSRVGHRHNIGDINGLQEALNSGRNGKEFPANTPPSGLPKGPLMFVTERGTQFVYFTGKFESNALSFWGNGPCEISWYPPNLPPYMRYTGGRTNLWTVSCIYANPNNNSDVFTYRSVVNKILKL